MKIAYLECFAGIAGDMFMGALVDAGVDTRLLQQAADSLQLGVQLEFQKVDRSGIRSTKARVMLHGEEADGGLQDESVHSSASHTHHHAEADGVGEHSHTHAHSHSETHTPGHSHAHTHDAGLNTHTHPHVHGRSLSEILDSIDRAIIPQGAKQLARQAFQLLGQSEAKIHGVPVEQIHFHEVGAVDAIVDIVCSAVGAHSLGVDAWYCSPVNTGSGFVDCAHGRFPVPAPATLDLLAGVPVYAEGPAKEMTTPTGAALLRALGCRFDAVPPFEVSSIGYGAGTRNPDRFPNVVRLRIGDAAARSLSSVSSKYRKDTVTVLECAIDDASPETLSYAAQQLMEQGALDVMQQPALMKKGRHGTLLTVLCGVDDVDRCIDLLFRETTTLGIRRREEQRVVLERRLQIVDTQYGPIHVKLGVSAQETLNAAPEFEDCRQAAQRHGVALKEVMQAAMSAAYGSAVEEKSAAALDGRQ